MSVTIIIPARYGSTRFPGKPLALLDDRTVLEHVHEKAVAAAANDPDVRVFVATDDQRILDFCKTKNFDALMTPEDCRTGSDRVIAAADQLGLMADDSVINLQGDAALMPVEAVRAVLEEFWNHPATKVATPIKRLRWDELDRLHDAKKTTPFSGTTVIVNNQNRALWFSKTIIPAIRGEDRLRAASPFSPVYQHLGLYGYQLSALERFAGLAPGVYEELEGLEQLRFLENHIPIQCIDIDPDLAIHPGIDSPQDLERAKTILQKGKAA